jgi:monoamine oxidase
MSGLRLSRRELLGSAVVGATGLAVGRALPATARPSARTQDRPDPGARARVVVIGAGLAGLTAALDLVDAGWDVVVCEARDRVGGRVHTVSNPFHHGLHAEAGGESIDDAHHDIRALVKRFGLRTEHRPVQKPYDATVFYRGRRTRLPAFLARRDGRVLRDVLRFYDAMAALADGMDPEYPERSPRVESLEARTLEDLLFAQRLVPEAEFLMRLQNRGEYNAELRDISLLFVAQQEAVAPDSTLSLVQAETMRISGGNSRLPRAMAAALGDRVRHASPVTAVEYSHHGVRVHAVGRPIDAAWLVVATPMQPLRRVRFSPALPASAAAVVSGLDLGSAVKVIREYAAPFWTAEAYSGFTVTDLPFAIGWSPTDSYPSTRGLLSEFITGDAAVHAAGLDDSSRVAWGQRQLDRVYPEAVPLRTHRATSMAWANEAYTGGGYAVYRPGQLSAFYPVLRDGVGPIRFAGEHACSLAGYMESAVRSGRRAARQIGHAPPPS